MVYRYVCNGFLRQIRLRSYQSALPVPRILVLCNHLQNVVATTYIFRLQLSTFIFYNKQTVALIKPDKRLCRTRIFIHHTSDIHEMYLQGSLPGDIRHAFSHNQREPSVGIHYNDLSDIPTSSFEMILSDPVHQLPESWSHHNGCICSLGILPSSAYKAVPDTGLHS